MAGTSEDIELLRRRIENASDAAERALLLGELVRGLEARTTTSLQPIEARDLLLAYTRRWLGQTLRALGRYAEAQTQLELALSWLEQATIGPPSEREIELVLCHHALGETHLASGRAVQALEAFGSAVARLERLVKCEHQSALDQALALSRDALATAARKLAEQGQELRLHRPLEAASAFERAIAAFESLPADAQHEIEAPLAACFNQLGSALALAGRFEEAVPAYQGCVFHYEKLAAREPAVFDPALAMTLSALAATWRELSRWSDAVDASKRAIELYDRLSRASSSSSYDLKLGRELERLREAQRRANPDSGLPGAAELGTRGSSRWLIGKIELSGTDRSPPPRLEPSVRGQAARPAPAAAPEPDRRLWCTTAGNLSRIVGELLDRGHRSTDMHTLATGLRGAQCYPARDFAQHCLPRRPDLFVSYNWEENFVDLQEAIHSSMRGIAQIIRTSRPEIESERLEHLCLDEIGIWIDFLFIDQNARDLLAEVNSVVPQAIEAADVHFVLSPTALARAWCCYELALFHRRAVTEKGTLASFVAPIGSVSYRGWSYAKTSNPADKPVLEQWLQQHYPGGVDAVDALLMMSSMLSDPFVVRSAAWSKSAEATVIESVDRWLAR